MLEFSFKYKDYEIRACPKHLARLSPEEKNVTIDFVKWDKSDNTGKPFCFSLGFFRRGTEGYYFNFVGDRPFRHIASEDIPVIWSVLKSAQEILDKFFTEEDLDND